MILIVILLFMIFFFSAGAAWLNLIDDITNQDEDADDEPTESRPRT